MASIPYKMKKLEKEHGPLEKVIPNLLEKHRGSQRAVAAEIGISQASISRWLAANGYTSKLVWYKPESEPA